MHIQAQHPSALHSVAICCFLMWSPLLACGPDVHEERCADVTLQIETALEDNIAKGVLFPTVVGCEVAQDSFDPRVDPSDVEYLLGAFQRACATQAEECRGISTPPPPSAPTPSPAPPPPSRLDSPNVSQ